MQRRDSVELYTIESSFQFNPPGAGASDQQHPVCLLSKPGHESHPALPLYFPWTGTKPCSVLRTSLLLGASMSLPSDPRELDLV